MGTPGPWIIHGNAILNGIRSRQIAAITPNGSHTAKVRAMTDEDTANARLIAAAPELLEALKNALDCLNPTEAVHVALLDTIMERARAVIAKAEGQS